MNFVILAQSSLQGKVQVTSPATRHPVQGHDSHQFASLSFIVIPAKAGTHVIRIQLALYDLEPVAKRARQCCTIANPSAPCTYILASKPHGVLYTGVTSNLSARMSDHVNGLYSGFTKTHAIKTLVYYEMHVTMDDAIKREKRIKDWKRAWKNRLIQNINPEWRDLYNRDTGELESGPADVERTRGRT